ncbi:hypothetical protein SEA_GALADRIEL_61 [Gordonia phage Galadriel]|uniref:Uncharacterized protein n=1 Tax=Gordonia phage Galadriel TaxID=2591208 RepID=A0A514DEP8_9CAUD|nr:hypothetical protein KNU61_gp61 [Gordonia phage Galadriel]QDH92080.1 hypothetical protein SEA_GALADRIEL_61 [Gordonia phage Galadriel]
MTNQKPSTPPAGPSGVSRPQDNADVQQALRRVNDVIGGALRQIAAITGQPDPAPPAAPAPNHLDAMRTAWDEGYYEGTRAGTNADGHASNPYAKLLDDRREYVREHVNNGYGTQLDENDDDVLGDDNAEWFDAVLDAHDEWRALQRHIEPQPTTTHDDAHLRAVVDTIREGGGTCEIHGVKIAKLVDDTGRTDTDVALVNAQIRAEQAEARVAALDGVLHRIADTTAPDATGDRSYEDMVDDARTVLTRAGYGTQPGGWVPPYSADTALGKIWHVVSNATVPERPEVTVNSVRDILADMGYHEHVHTRRATADDAPDELCGASEATYACTKLAGHDGDHADGQYGVTWTPEAVTDEDPLPGCTSTHALGIAVYTCTRPAGHDAYHQDKRYGVAWAADGSSSWRVK